jgi:hypothetical protein
MWEIMGNYGKLWEHFRSIIKMGYATSEKVKWQFLNRENDNDF